VGSTNARDIGCGCAGVAGRRGGFGANAGGSRRFTGHECSAGGAHAGGGGGAVCGAQETRSAGSVSYTHLIGRTARYVPEDQALDHVAGYCVVNDVSERAYQLERGGTWDKGKGCDTFGPVGPYLVTADEVGDPQRLDMWLDLNGKRMQSGSTKTMIFPVRTLVSYISRFMTLEPGDLITTGTCLLYTSRCV